jgi:hypothetical protein
MADPLDHYKAKRASYHNFDDEDVDALIRLVEDARAEAERERQQRDYISLVAQRDIERLRAELAEQSRKLFLAYGDPPLPDHLLPDNLKDALAEIQRLRRYRSLGQIPRLDQLLDERDQARAEVERRLELLRSLEWAGRDGLWEACPACNGRQRDGHVGIGPERAPCWLAAELRPPDPPPS